jgi:hypothetical protein
MSYQKKLLIVTMSKQEGLEPSEIARLLSLSQDEVENVLKEAQMKTE